MQYKPWSMQLLNKILLKHNATEIKSSDQHLCGFLITIGSAKIKRFFNKFKASYSG